MNLNDLPFVKNCIYCMSESVEIYAFVGVLVADNLIMCIVYHIVILCMIYVYMYV